MGKPAVNAQVSSSSFVWISTNVNDDEKQQQQQIHKQQKISKTANHRRTQSTSYSTNDDRSISSHVSVGSDTSTFITSTAIESVDDQEETVNDSASNLRGSASSTTNESSSNSSSSSITSTITATTSDSSFTTFGNNIDSAVNDDVHTMVITSIQQQQTGMEQTDGGGAAIKKDSKVIPALGYSLIGFFLFVSLVSICVGIYTLYKRYKREQQYGNATASVLSGTSATTGGATSFIRRADGTMVVARRATKERVLRRYETVEHWIVTKHVQSHDAFCTMVTSNFDHHNSASKSKTSNKKSSSLDNGDNNEATSKTPPCITEGVVVEEDSSVDDVDAAIEDASIELDNTTSSIRSKATTASKQKEQQQSCCGSSAEYHECPICMSELLPNQIVSWSANPTCSHVFHHECIKEWLLRHVECCLCKQIFLPIDEQRSNRNSATNTATTTTNAQQQDTTNSADQQQSSISIDAGESNNNVETTASATVLPTAAAAQSEEVTALQDLSHVYAAASATSYYCATSGLIRIPRSVRCTKSELARLEQRIFDGTVPPNELSALRGSRTEISTNGDEEEEDGQDVNGNAPVVNEYNITDDGHIIAGGGGSTTLPPTTFENCDNNSTAENIDCYDGAAAAISTSSDNCDPTDDKNKDDLDQILQSSLNNTMSSATTATLDDDDDADSSFDHDVETSVSLVQNIATSSYIGSGAAVDQTTQTTSSTRRTIFRSGTNITTSSNGTSTHGGEEDDVVAETLVSVSDYLQQTNNMTDNRCCISCSSSADENDEIEVLSTSHHILHSSVL